VNGRSILFVSVQGGMGHVTRDLAIVQELRRAMPEVDVSWIAHAQAASFLVEAGERILGECEQVVDYNRVAKRALREFGLDLVEYAKLTREPKRRNAMLVEQLQRKYRFELIVGDEIYGTLIALAQGEIQLDCPVIMIEDFISLRSTSKNPFMRLAAYVMNRRLVKSTENTASQIEHLFVGEWEDIPNRRFDWFLPRCRDFARRYYRVLGYIVRFDPEDFRDRARIRSKLGYGPEPLIICATGGTMAGKELLELCGRAYPLLKKDIPELRMVFVCGESYGLEPPRLPDGAELHSFLPDIYEHYACCDLAVVVGGGTTTIELTALRTPFLFFPLENQFDQQLYVSERIARHGAGVRMDYRRTTPEKLARAMKDNLGRRVEPSDVAFDGARKAAEIIVETLNGAWKQAG